MFLQRTTSRRGEKTYVSYLVREGFRTDKGPRSRTVCNVTGLPEEARDALGLALKGKQLVAFSDLELTDCFDYGGLAVLRDAWQRWGLEAIFDPSWSSRERGLLRALVFGRLLFPCSKRALATEARGTLLAGACGLDQREETFDEDDLYRAMDLLTGQWVPVERRLFAKAFTGPIRLVLYDLTSVYFEGKGPQGLARYGYSRDHRGDRHQMLLAVATDEKGVPIHIEVLRGNRGDTTTLQSLLTTLRRRFGLGADSAPGTEGVEVVFSFDGGMSSRLNLAAIEAEKLHYVTRLSKAQLGALLKKLPQDRQPELFDCTRIIEIEHDKHRYVLAGGAMRRHRDAERRQVRLRRAEAKLAATAAVDRKEVDPQKLASQVGRLLQRAKAHKYFSYRVDEAGLLHWERKQSVIDAQARLDGWYILRTNLACEQADKEQVHAHYKQLMEVEAAFRELKTYLKVRPVYHYRVDRVRNHVRICFLAYWMSARLSLEWRSHGETRRVPEILRSLQTIRVGMLSVAGNGLGRLLTQIPPELNETLNRLELLKLFSSPPAWSKL